MERKSIYIKPESEDYAGYTTFIFAGSSTSSYEDLYSQGGDVITILEGEEDKEQDEETFFPETREKGYLDEDLLRFYRKKGYEN